MMTLRLRNPHANRVLTRTFDNPIIASQWYAHQRTLGYDIDDDKPTPHHERGCITRDPHYTCCHRVWYTVPERDPNAPRHHGVDDGYMPPIPRAAYRAPKTRGDWKRSPRRAH